MTYEERNSEFRDALARFRRRPTAPTLNALRIARMQAAHLLLQDLDAETSDRWQGASSSFFSPDVAASGLNHLPISEEETRVFHALRTRARAKWPDEDSVTHLCGALLFKSLHHMDLDAPAPDAHPRALKAYADGAPFRVFAFQDDEDADRYCRFIAGFVDWSCRLYQECPDRALARSLLQEIAARLTLLPLYFTEANLRPQHERFHDLLGLFLDSRTGGVIKRAWSPPDTPNQPLKLGVVVNSAAAGVESFVILAAIPRLADDPGIELWLYLLKPAGDGFESHVAAHFDHVRDLGSVSLQASVDAIRDDRLDALWIANHEPPSADSKINMLTVHRLARRTFIATTVHSGTSGLPCCDAVLTSKWSEDLDAAGDHYTEKINLLDGSFNCFDRRHFMATVVPDQPVRIDLDKARGEIRAEGVDEPQSLDVEDCFVFCSGAALPKLSSYRLVEAWVRILAACDRAVLLLYAMNPNWVKSGQALLFQIELRFHALFAAHGVAPRRVRMLPTLNAKEIAHLMGEADVYLDSFPFTGGASVVEPLEAGVPVLTRRCTAHRGRQGAGMLEMLGLPDLVAESDDDYVDKAVALYRDRAALAELRSRTGEAMASAPFLDVDSFSASFADGVRRVMADGA